MSTELEVHDPNVLTSLRVSNAEREHAKKKIRKAAKEGRISDDEYVARLTACDDAKHQQNLDYLHKDLPPMHKIPPQGHPLRTWFMFAGLVLGEIVVTGLMASVFVWLLSGLLAGWLIGTTVVLGIAMVIVTVLAWTNWYDAQGKK